MEQVSLCTLHVGSYCYRSMLLELDVCSLLSGFLGWNLCGTECSCGYNNGFIVASQASAWYTTGAVGLMDNGKDQNANPLWWVTYSKQTFIGVMESCCRGKYSYPVMSECTMTCARAQQSVRFSLLYPATKSDWCWSPANAAGSVRVICELQWCLSGGML